MIGKTKNLLIIIPYGSVGGMERLALNFYNYLKAEQYRVYVLKFIKLESDIINFDEDELFLSEVDFSEMSLFHRIIFYLTIPFKIRNIISAKKIESTISFGDMSNFYSSITFTKEFKIGSIHALKSVELGNPTLFNKITKLGYRHTYGNLNKLVCISKAIESDLIQKCSYKYSNTQVIYNPHNIKQIEFLSLEAIDSIEELKLFEKKSIVFLGRLSIQKSPWHLINAFHLIWKKEKEINLIFIGDGDKNIESFLKKQIESLNLNDNVFFLGRKSNPYKYLKRSNLLALSSNYEGTPNVIVESIIVGTPVVSTFCTDGILEIMAINDPIKDGNNFIVDSGAITPNIYTGYLEIPSNLDIEEGVEDLASGIDRVLSDPNIREKLENNRNVLLAKFDMEEVIKLYLHKTELL